MKKTIKIIIISVIIIAVIYGFIKLWIANNKWGSSCETAYGPGYKVITVVDHETGEILDYCCSNGINSYSLNKNSREYCQTE